MIFKASLPEVFQNSSEVKSKAGFREVVQAPGHQVEYIIHEEHERNPAQTSGFREKHTTYF